MADMCPTKMLLWKDGTMCALKEAGLDNFGKYLLMYIVQERNKNGMGEK